MKTVRILAAALVAWSAVLADAQTADKDVRPLIARALQARAEGRFQDAIELADRILATSPASRDAVAVKIAACLDARKQTAALDAYDRFADVTKTEDRRLLAMIASSELRQLSTGTHEETLKTGALERLARNGDSGARQTLALAATDERTLTMRAVAPDASLARLGDAKAMARLAEMLTSEQGASRLVIIEALKSAGAKQFGYAVRPLLDDPAPIIKAGAASAMGELQVLDAIPKLRELLQDPILIIQLSAAVALRRLGETSVDRLLARWLESEAADVRLAAAQAYVKTSNRNWVTAVRPLLNDPDGLTRLQAAELLQPIDTASAHAVLVKAMADSNPNIRAEATRILASTTPLELRIFRRSLRDSSPWVRLHAADAVLSK